MLKFQTTDDITAFISHKIYYGSPHALVNQPKPFKTQLEPTCIHYDILQPAVLPECSLVMPIHDMETVIARNVTSALVQTTGPFEVILILDGCSDNSKTILLELFNKQRAKWSSRINLVSIMIIEQPNSIFETACDNLGLRLSSAPYVMELQADMEMIQYGYNEMLMRPVRIYDDVIAVSGRMTRELKLPKGEKKFPGIGKQRWKIKVALDVALEDHNKFHIYGTVIRGPLLFVRDKVEQLGFLDEQNFYQDHSEFDLFMRAYHEHRYVTGYVPIEFKAPLEDGTNRKPRPKEEDALLKLRIKRSRGGALKKLKKKVSIPKEVRELPHDSLLISG